MPTYRILVFDYGHINASHTVEAKTDDDAIKAAQELQIASDVEVWERDRFMAAEAAAGLEHFLAGCTTLSTSCPAIAVVGRRRFARLCAGHPDSWRTAVPRVSGWPGQVRP